MNSNGESRVAGDRRLFLGVDGGGTKTALALLTDRGELQATALAPSSYYLGHDIGIVESVLRQGIDAVLSQAGVGADRIAHAFFAFPGYGEVSADVPFLNAIPGRILGHDRYGCDNDMVAGWAGSLAGGDGVNVIAGTGSMTYGEHNGRGVRVGGWGELFDDEGSGYWIAIRGLNVFARMSDGRAPIGPLHERLIRHLELTSALDLVDVVLNRWHGDRAKVASLARVVTDAASEGDSACLEILRDAGEALANLVTATIAQLGYAAEEDVPVSWSGGVFTDPVVRASFREQLPDDHVDLREPLLPPVLGAALYAARQAGTPLTTGAISALAATITTSQGDRVE